MCNFNSELLYEYFCGLFNYICISAGIFRECQTVFWGVEIAEHKVNQNCCGNSAKKLSDQIFLMA